LQLDSLRHSGRPHNLQLAKDRHVADVTYNVGGKAFVNTSQTIDQIAAQAGAMLQLDPHFH
jgi:hypothetical protein